AELEADVLDRVAVVVDVDLVQRVLVHGEVVRAAVGILEWDVVGDQRDVVRSACFVRTEHVEVGAVDLGLRGDERRFAMARALSWGGGEWRWGGEREPRAPWSAFHGRAPHVVEPSAATPDASILPRLLPA